MLKQLTIKNLAIIDDITIDFDEHLNVLTGETGAGKSIIIDAISLVFGARASGEIIAQGKESATIQAVLYLSEELAAELSRLTEIDVEDECIITRIININGRNVCKVNGMIVPLFTISELASKIIDISGQYESQYLLKSKNHLPLLDAYIESKKQGFKNDYERLYANYVDVRKQYEEENQRSMDESELEFLQFKLQELKDYHHTTQDEDAIMEEFKKLRSFEKNATVIEEILDHFSSDDGIESKMYTALKQLGKFSGQQPYLSYYDQLNEIYINLLDWEENFRHDCKMEQFDPQRLDELENEITRTNLLKRKYHVNDLLAYKNQLQSEINAFSEHEMNLSFLNKRLQEAKKLALEEAKKIHDIRCNYAQLLSDEIVAELRDLYLDDAEFTIHFESIDLQEDGADKIEFYLSTNKGMESRPLVKVASGGEVSRIMLGLKSVFAALSRKDVVIFDEIDTGVSGKVALSMGKKMEAIASNCQVLAITHLPQVAAMSDHHYYISKETVDGRSKTKVCKLDENGKKMEVARLLSGNQISESFIRAAEELIISK